MTSSTGSVHENSAVGNEPASLRTARLLLRPWRAADIPAFAGLSADPEVMQFLRPLPDRPAAEAWVKEAQAHWRRHGFGRWVVELPGEAPFVGVIGLTRVRYAAHFTPAVEIAWRLARRYWGRGYATEAARAALDYGFGTLGLEEIVAITVPANLRSCRVMERLGMTRLPQEDFDHPDAPEGPLRRCILYRLRNPLRAA
jgi:RimJ/RimL family protein N-acetyltransferase